MISLIKIYLIIQIGKNNNQKLTTNDAERYFTVETARGYIVINREYEKKNIYLSFK